MRLLGREKRKKCCRLPLRSNSARNLKSHEPNRTGHESRLKTPLNAKKPRTKTHKTLFFSLSIKLAERAAVSESELANFTTCSSAVFAGFFLMKYVQARTGIRKYVWRLCFFSSIDNRLHRRRLRKMRRESGRQKKILKFSYLDKVLWWNRQLSRNGLVRTRRGMRRRLCTRGCRY